MFCILNDFMFGRIFEMSDQFSCKNVLVNPYQGHWYVQPYFTYIHIHIRMYVRTYIHTHIHTYIHTYDVDMTIADTYIMTYSSSHCHDT